MTAQLPPGPYDLALIDPPWAFRAYSGADRTPTRKKNAAGEQVDHYPTMRLEELKALPVGKMMARNSAIAMWVIGSHLGAALELGQAWGFKATTDLFYWAKQKLIAADQIDLFTGDIAPPKLGMGYYSRKQVEPCWLFTRGSGIRVHANDVRQLIVAPSLGHSRKPAEQYDRLERLFGTPSVGGNAGPRCIELFARNTRRGWDSWGNEVGKFDEVRA